MPNQKIFCNVPWTNTHIYWDGGFGSCCSEATRPYDNDQWETYNIKNMSIPEWHNSEPMKKFRAAMHGTTAISACSRCYFEENSKYESRRIKENFKSVIFTEKAFDKSYLQSPWYSRFESAKSNDDQAAPIDWHIDLGNECNLACKMCNPRASSIIASKYKTWNLPVESRKNWVNNEKAWKNFIQSVHEVRNLNRIHFMGGEPMLSKKFKEFIDYLIDNNLTNLSISFVTNGTIYNKEIIDKLKKFKSADVEVSLESIEDNNDYIRQGSDTKQVIEHITNLGSQQTDTFHVVLRSVPQLLNINNYHKYIGWAFKNNLPIQGIPLNTPNYLAISVLPDNIRHSFIKNYQEVISQLEKQPLTPFKTISQGRDTSRLDLQLIKECRAMIDLLSAPEPDNCKDLRKQLAYWLMKWDKEYNLNAYNYYPEYAEFFREIGYEK